VAAELGGCVIGLTVPATLLLQRQICTWPHEVQFHTDAQLHRNTPALYETQEQTTPIECIFLRRVLF
jgi:hypothetical protein